MRGARTDLTMPTRLAFVVLVYVIAITHIDNFTKTVVANINGEPHLAIMQSTCRGLKKKMGF